jgi:hypothetical protein
MTKQIVMALALVVGTAGAASAQSITASASVAQVAQATGTQRNVVFPAGTPGGAGGSAVLAAATGANATGPQLGFVEYQLNYSGPSVAVSAPATLSDGGTNTIAVGFTCGESNATGTGLALAACGTHSLTFVGTGLQTRRVWVGGSISQAAIDAAAATTYSGTITLTLTP